MSPSPLRPPRTTLMKVKQLVLKIRINVRIITKIQHIYFIDKYLNNYTYMDTVPVMKFVTYGRIGYEQIYKKISWELISPYICLGAEI